MQNAESVSTNIQLRQEQLILDSLTRPYQPRPRKHYRLRTANGGYLTIGGKTIWHSIYSAHRALEKQPHVKALQDLDPELDYFDAVDVACDVIDRLIRKGAIQAVEFNKHNVQTRVVPVSEVLDDDEEDEED